MMYDIIYKFVDSGVSVLEGLKCSAAIKRTIADRVLDKQLAVLDDEADMFDMGDGKPTSLIMCEAGNEDFKPDAEMAMAFVMNLRSGVALRRRVEKAVEPDSGDFGDVFGAVLSRLAGGMALRPCEEDFTMLLDVAEALMDHAESWLDGHDEIEDLPNEVYAMIGIELAMAAAFVEAIIAVVSDEHSELIEGDVESISARAEELSEAVDDMLAVTREALHTGSDCGHCSNCDEGCDCDGEGCECKEGCRRRTDRD